MVNVYMRVELSNGQTLTSEVFEMTQEDYDHYWDGKYIQDSELWDEAWLEFEDDIVESVLELADQKETAEWSYS